MHLNETYHHRNQIFGNAGFVRNIVMEVIKMILLENVSAAVEK